MNPWLIYPTWQTFSSFFREIVTADGEQSEFLKYHHLTSSLYYAIGFVEALLNEKHRLRLERTGIKEETIISILRSGACARDEKTRRGFERKLSEWPSIICDKEVKVSEDLKGTLVKFNDIRGNLTHPKSRGHDLYADLEKINSQQLLLALAEYAVAIFSGLGEEYPYWLFGWNYINPSKTIVDLSRINNQEFVHSLAHFGLKIQPFDSGANTAWRETHMRNFDGYKKVNEFLGTCRNCEPLDPIFPLRPRLAKEWWDSTILEKHKDYIRGCSPPYFAGTRKLAVSFITPLQVVAKPSKGK